MKKKIIIVFIALLALSWFASISKMLSSPKELQAHLDKAEDYEEREIYVDAIAEYEVALQANPDDVSILLKMAKDYLLIEDERKYTATLERAVEKEKKGSDEALDLLMNYYIEDEKEDRAAKYIKDRAEKSPDNAHVQEWYLKLKGTYREVFCRYSEMYGMYNDSMVVKVDEDENIFSIIDSSGNRLFEKGLSELTPFSSDGLARTVGESGNTIYIDCDGLTRVSVDGKYKDVGIINKSRIAVSSNGKYGYLDEKGEPVTDFKWSGLSAFNDVGAAQLNGKWAIIGSKGKDKTEYTYDDVATDPYGVACNQKRLFVKTDGKYKLVNTKGKEISEDGFDDVKIFTPTGAAAVCKGGKWGFVNADGELIIDYQYDDALSFANGFAAVRQGDLWGYVDEEGNLIIKPVFVEATSFSSEGTVAVKIKRDDDKPDEWRLIKLNTASY